MLVDWLFELGEKFKQSNLTVHIAVGYLERAHAKGFFRKKEGTLKDINDLRKVAVACLVMASKYDELDDRIPFN